MTCYYPIKQHSLASSVKTHRFSTPIFNFFLDSLSLLGHKESVWEKYQAENFYSLFLDFSLYYLHFNVAVFKEVAVFFITLY